MESRKRSSSLDLLSSPTASLPSERPQSFICETNLNSLPKGNGHSGSMEDGVNLVSYRKINTLRPIASTDRWHSDTNLVPNTEQDGSKLTVNKVKIDIDGDNEIVLYWDIKLNVSAKDWIGLYKVDETHPSRWLDYRSRGLSGSKKGELVWNLERIVSAFSKPETRVCFRYYHGNTGDLIAVSSSITVRNRNASNFSTRTASRSLSTDGADADIIHLALQDLEAFHVRKGMFFNPDPYVKIRIEPSSRENQPVCRHHFKESRTTVCENTTEPKWKYEVFHFMALPNDNLFIKVKDRFTSSRPTLLRFLGQICVPIKQVIEKARLNMSMTCPLQGRTPHDHVCGTLMFKPTIIPYDAKRILINGHKTRMSQSIDSRVENALERSSADVIADSSDSDEEIQRRPTIKALTHTNSGTSGDSSIGVGMSQRNSMDSPDIPVGPITSSEPINITTPVVFTVDMCADEDQNQAGSPEVFSSLQSNILPPDFSADLPSRASSPDNDMLTAYEREVSQAMTREDLENQEAQAAALDAISDIGAMQTAVDVKAPFPKAETQDVAIAVASSVPEHLKQANLGVSRPASDCSMENHVGSREDSPSTDKPNLADNITLYMNMSESIKSTPSALPDSYFKRPLPQPRTMAEQLKSLHIIESDVDPSLIQPSKAPDIPAKARNVKTYENVPDSPYPQHLPAMHAASLDMPTDLAPPVPSGSKPKRLAKNAHQDVAEIYGDAPDGIFSRNKVEPAPKLKPRKGRPNEENPPQLPPRRAKGDAPQGTQHELNDVFEPQATHEHHPRLKKQMRTASQIESEEARVAAEVANAGVEVEEALPSGWEARVDSHGRVFYIDHNNKITTWNKPAVVRRGHPPPLTRVPSISNTDRRNMDTRYRNIQRIASIDAIPERPQSPSPPQQAAPPLPTHVEPVSAPPAANEGTPTVPPAQPKPEIDQQHKEEIVRGSPAVKFITRTDFFSQVQYSDEAQVAYTSNSALKHMVHRIRKDPMNFTKYWHNKDLVNFLNMFANKEDPLPENWQMKCDKTGKMFFLDHTTKTTTFIDPRLPVIQPLLNPGIVIPLPRGQYRPEETPSQETAAAPAAISTDLVPTAYNEKVVLFLRQPNVYHVLQERYPLIRKNEALRTKISNIISDGVQALRKYRNNIELTMLLSMFENEIMTYIPPNLRTQQEHTSPKGSPVAGRRHVAPLYKRDFQEKYRNFLRKLEAKGYGQGPGKIKMRVRRDHILEDSFKKIMPYTKRDLQKSKLLISFLGEEGLDYGGPAREFFFLLSRELFNPYYGLFEYSANDTYTVQISPVSTFVDNASEWFRFAGRMIGLCIVHQYLMDSFFTRPFYKMLLREPCVLSDLESLDAEYHQSLLWIKDNDITEAGLDLTFSVNEEVFGQVIERELKPNGKEIPVTNKNKKEYIEKMVAWRIDRGVHEQKDFLMRGFYEVIDPKVLGNLDAKDLELVIAGTAEIDVADWRNNTEYRSGYYDGHSVIIWFWEVIESFDNEKRLRLLQFVTGTSSIPFEGFSALRGSNGPRKFTIEKWGNPESLPRAHTCFNRLDLPTYTCKETMQEKLLLAISETSTFGIE